MISMEARKQYLENPCRAASVPYWKAVCISVPDNIRILHDSEFNTELLRRYVDEPYFRLQHRMMELKPVSLPEGYSLYEATVPDFVEHINSCYEDIGITVSELQSYLAREQYSPELWLAVRDDCNGKIAATGIAELDLEIGAILDFELAGYGSRDFDIAWALFLRPGQKFLKTDEELERFLRGYQKYGDCNVEAVKYYMAQCYVHFLCFCEDIDYCEYVRNWLERNCRE